MAVITAFEFDDFVPAGEAPRQPDGGHTGLGAAAGHPHFFDRRDPAGDLPGHLDFERVGDAEAGALFGGGLLDEQGAAAKRAPYTVALRALRVRMPPHGPRAGRRDAKPGRGCDSTRAPPSPSPSTEPPRPPGPGPPRPGARPAGELRPFLGDIFVFHKIILQYTPHHSC